MIRLFYLYGSISEIVNAPAAVKAAPSDGPSRGGAVEGGRVVETDESFVVGFAYEYRKLKLLTETFADN